MADLTFLSKKEIRESVLTDKQFQAHCHRRAEENSILECTSYQILGANRATINSDPVAKVDCQAHHSANSAASLTPYCKIIADNESATSLIESKQTDVIRPDVLGNFMINRSKTNNGTKSNTLSLNSFELSVKAEKEYLQDAESRCEFYSKNINTNKRSCKELSDGNIVFTENKKVCISEFGSMTDSCWYRESAGKGEDINLKNQRSLDYTKRLQDQEQIIWQHLLFDSKVARMNQAFWFRALKMHQLLISKHFEVKKDKKKSSN